MSVAVKNSLDNFIYLISMESKTKWKWILVSSFYYKNQ